MKRVDAEIEQKVLELNTGAFTKNEVAQMLGIDPSTVYRICDRNNVSWIWKHADQAGEKNNNYKDGLGRSTIERTTRQIMLNQGRDLFLCERCGHKSRTSELPRHHKDEDRSNNSPENLEIICQSCHTKEHNSRKERLANGQFK